MGKTELFMRKQPGGVYTVVNESMTTGNIFWVDSGQTTTGGTTTGYGNNPDKPFTTIDSAINACTASNGDIIFVMPGHAENITAAGTISLDVNGVTIIGLGYGDARPTITATTGAAASMAVTGTDCTIKNLLFVCNIASQNHMIDLAADDFTVDNCEFREGSATGLTFITCDTTDADSDRLHIKNCRFYAPTAGNYDAAITIGKDMVDVRIEDCEFIGDYDNATIEVPAGGNASTNLQIHRNRIQNTQSGIHAIEINGTTVTGSVLDNHLQTDAIQTAMDTALCRCAGNTWSAVGSELTGLGDVFGGDIAYGRLNYLAVDADLTSATWASVASHEVFTVTGDVRVRIVPIVGTSLVANSTIALGTASHTTDWISATSATALDAGEIWQSATPASNKKYIAKSSVLDYVVANGDDIGYTIASTTGTTGTITFHCWWEPLSSTGLVVAGAGGSL